jgi:hypothetical protein
LFSAEEVVRCQRIALWFDSPRCVSILVTARLVATDARPPHRVTLTKGALWISAEERPLVLVLDLFGVGLRGERERYSACSMDDLLTSAHCRSASCGRVLRVGGAIRYEISKGRRRD